MRVTPIELNLRFFYIRGYIQTDSYIMTQHWGVALSHCFTQLHSHRAVADDSTLAVSHRSGVIYDSVGKGVYET